jgi:hypothetical protein
MTIGVDEAMSSQGTYITTGDGASPEEFTNELAQVISIGGPKETSEELDVTHLRSPGAYREFLQSFKDGGELPMTLNFLPSSTSQNGYRADFEANPQTVRNRRIHWPDGSTDTFKCFVKGIGRQATVGQKLTLDITLRISGPVHSTEAGGSPV